MPRLDLDPHTALHRAITNVPAPDRYTAGRVLRAYEPGRTVFESMDNLCFAFEQAGQHPKSTQLERSCGELIIASVRAQIPFIEEGLI